MYKNTSDWHSFSFLYKNNTTIRQFQRTQVLITENAWKVSMARNNNNHNKIIIIIILTIIIIFILSYSDIKSTKSLKMWWSLLVEFRQYSYKKQIRQEIKIKLESTHGEQTSGKAHQCQTKWKHHIWYGSQVRTHAEIIHRSLINCLMSQGLPRSKISRKFVKNRFD